MKIMEKEPSILKEYVPRLTGDRKKDLEIIRKNLKEVRDYDQIVGFIKSIMPEGYDLQEITDAEMKEGEMTNWASLRQQKK